MNKKIMLVLAALLTTFASLSAKTALIIVAHGSPMESWRKPVLALEPLVKEQVEKKEAQRYRYCKGGTYGIYRALRGFCSESM